RTAQTRSDERRVLDIVTEGSPGTTLDLGLLVQTPVWKPTWRLLLDGPAARIQGWAVVDNRTGHDWQGVQLTLVDGDADTLRQELARTWFVERPTVPVLPDGGVGPMAREFGAERGAKVAALAAPELMNDEGRALSSEAAPVMEATGTESDLATTFTIDGRLDVADDGSLMVPLLYRPVPAERIAFVPGSGTGGAPQSAIRLTNDTGQTLPSGIVTVMDTTGGPAPTHVGDAVLPTIPQGSQRRLAFGADRKISYAIDQDDTREVRTLALADGVLTLTVAERQARRWAFRSDDDQPRQLEVEAWVPAGAQPVAPADPRRDGSLWYVTGELPARGETSLELVTELPIEERFVLSPDETLDTILAARGLTIPDSWRARLAEIGALAARRADAERRLAQLAEERAGIVAEQERVRANLESVSEAGPLRERWLTELGSQEDRLAAIEQERRQVVVQRDEAAAALRAVVTELRR
ncbi:MAG TPA: DUF4139 domain-containing protein, partial [Geminicoccus sp.]|uniref:DUF4139 domain-containing protein n=1 Tax=Geminicoccus sp. TaxID=2024832 RepID=UPI002E30DA1D